ncbi:DUF6221 family protein [Streptomyces niveus]|uniref:DUF6221 family protein n=1 Tax=Streptomyces niveus TaxID=193462 RepID=UPI00341944BC
MLVPVDEGKSQKVLVRGVVPGAAHESARRRRGEAPRIDDGAVLATNLEQGGVGHIARHDPACVLREIQAHRTTVDEYDIALGVCLRIAAVHADHPDCMEAWRP